MCLGALWVAVYCGCIAVCVCARMLMHIGVLLCACARMCSFCVKNTHASSDCQALLLPNTYIMSTRLHLPLTQITHHHHHHSLTPHPPITNHTPGFAIANHLLQHKSPSHLSLPLLHTIQHLITNTRPTATHIGAPATTLTTMTTTSGVHGGVHGGVHESMVESYQADVLRSMLLAPELWSRADSTTQHHVQAVCMTLLEVCICSCVCCCDGFCSTWLQCIHSQRYAYTP